MKTLLAIFACSAVFVVSSAAAQPPEPNAAGVGAAGPSGHHSPAMGAIASAAARHGMTQGAWGYPSIEATVSSLLLSPHAEVEGLLLANGMVVKWPKHQGEELAALVKPGMAVRLAGHWHKRGQFKAWSITSADRTLVRTERPWPQMPASMRIGPLQPLQISGTLQHVIAGRRGEPQRLVLDAGQQVHLPKHAAWMLGSSLQPGTPLQVEGYGRRGPQGLAIEAVQIAVRGSAPVVLYPGAR
ncbi:hypothetical protein [Caldimonas sp.]|uniref:hypothetical protein n=1 Tax=Caldimonas sp. TaxID=2838790 RepID=UPI00391A1A39